MSFALCFLASCTKDDAEIFPESAADRLDGTAENDIKILESATNGWELHYYTGTDYTGGGYTMLVKFKDGKVRVSADFAPADSVAVSSYDVIKDQGPVLTFNTYNELLHVKANPSYSALEGEQADYEFVVQSVSNDTILLKGRKFGNHMEMIRMPEDRDWKTYLTGIQNMDNSMGLTFYNSTSTQTATTSLVFDSETRRAKVTTNGNTTTVPYYVTTTGVHLGQGITIDGTSVQNLTYSPKDSTMTAQENSQTYRLIRPDYYMSYEDFAGAWVLVDYYGQYNINLEPTDDRTGFTMTGMNKKITPYIHYNRADGSIEWLTQFACYTNTGFVYMCAWNAQTGSISVDTSTGLAGKRDLSQSGTVVTFDPNDNDYGFKADSFLLYEFDNSGNDVGISSLVFGYSAQIPYISQMLRN